LVDEKNIAYHAGVSKMPDGRTGVNNFSIGIELMNTKKDSYTESQYSGLNKLIDYLENNHQIKYVLGHQDISPDRKTDPWNFNWKKVNSSKSIHN
jgi:AmpD protein